MGEVEESGFFRLELFLQVDSLHYRCSALLSSK